MLTPHMRPSTLWHVLCQSEELNSTSTRGHCGDENINRPRSAPEQLENIYKFDQQSKKDGDKQDAFYSYVTKAKETTARQSR